MNMMTGIIELLMKMTIYISLRICIVPEVILEKNECKNIVTYDLATGAAYHKQWKLTVEVIELDINDFQAPYRIRWVDEPGQTHVTWADYNHIQPINY